MNDLKADFQNYEEYKQQFDRVMNRTVGSFVTIGYLLTVAKETDILRESGYTTMGEFAEKEYKLSESQASRFISIYEKYGDGIGNLLPEYRQYSYSLLCEMVTLPETVALEITADYSREDIRELKKELAEEQKTTDLEIFMEGPQTDPALTALLKEYLHSDPDVFAKAWDRLSGIIRTEDTNWRPVVLDILAPDGIGIVGARVQGMGRMMLSFKGENESPVLINPRAEQKREVFWQDIADAMSDIVLRGGSIEESWESLYGETFPVEEQEKQHEPEPKKEKKIKIAPAQEKKQGSRNEQKAGKEQIKGDDCKRDGGDDQRSGIHTEPAEDTKHEQETQAPDDSTESDEELRGSDISPVTHGEDQGSGTRQYIYAVDFDGTLCTNMWPDIGEPNMELINEMIRRRKEGCAVILWTMRGGQLLHNATAWCRQHGLEFDAVNDNLKWQQDYYGDNPRKVFADEYIDDRNRGWHPYVEGEPYDTRIRH